MGWPGCSASTWRENFRRPLFSTSLTDFWRRWHITLGAWMRDYLFYPLSLSKPFGKLGKFTRKHLKGKLGKILPTSLATFLVYFVIGIWHGRQLAVCGLRLLERRNHHPFPAAGPVFFALEAGPTYQRQVQRLGICSSWSAPIFWSFSAGTSPGRPVPHRGLW